MSAPRDHGGGLDAAIDRFGGKRSDWIDLSTGINPVPYRFPAPSPESWQALPDIAAQNALIVAARRFWKVPDEAAILAAPGASSIIARIPMLSPAGSVHIPAPTYNEHAAAFRDAGWTLSDTHPRARVVVHPNNPDGHLWSLKEARRTGLTIIDESFCDTCPDRSLIAEAGRPGTIILKSFGKFWGLAGLRLGFAIGDPQLIARLSDMLGPWPVSGPALEIARRALSDTDWAHETRSRLVTESARLDNLMERAGLDTVGGTSLFRLYDCKDATALQDRLARARIWTRVFPYSSHWLRLGLPGPADWDRLDAAL